MASSETQFLHPFPDSIPELFISPFSINQLEEPSLDFSHTVSHISMCLERQFFRASNALDFSLHVLTL